MACFKQLTIAEAVSALPYAYYKCDEPAGSLTAVDSISAFDLTTVNPIVKWPTAKIGTAFWDPLLNLRNTPDIHWDFSTTGFTVRFWFEMGSINGNNSTFFILNTQRWEVTLKGQLFPFNHQWPQLKVTLADGDHTVDGPDLTDTTAFHRLMCGWEKGVGIWIKFDNDPTIAVAATANAAFLGAAEGFFLGPTNEPQQMGIDEVGIWNRTLSEAEKTFDWNGGAGRTYP